MSEDTLRTLIMTVRDDITNWRHEITGQIRELRTEIRHTQQRSPYPPWLKLAATVALTTLISTLAARTIASTHVSYSTTTHEVQK